MIQLTQNLKTGKMELLEVPMPALNTGMLLVRNHYSVISSGTEGKSVGIARAGYIAKAKEKPKEVKHVMESVKEKGLVSTYRLVMNKLDFPSQLGYSCAGEVIEVGEGITEFKVGDRVSCGGNNAVHAEVVSIPKNLCVGVPPGVDMRFAAFTTIGAIALQGIRQSDLRMGESCVVIGLGLIGQITVQLLKAGGINSIGIDIDKYKVDMADNSGADLALLRTDPSLEDSIMEYTNGFGVDAVIITAGTSSLDPIELGGVLCRKKGRVVIVGSVPTGFSRENYYRKELELRMSCSYGPGRYDPQYEDKGIDYPIGYVRWTEKRNMEAFVKYLVEKKIDLTKVITHTYSFEKAREAYEMILEAKEPHLGIILKYDSDKPVKKVVKVQEKEGYREASLGIGLIGAGSFAQNILLPILGRYKNLVAVADIKGNVARSVADKYGFHYCFGDAEEIIHNDRVNTVFITTPHHLHAGYVLKAIRKNKNVYVEKPLCMKQDELEEIREEYLKRNIHLMVGFNRRFSPFVQKIMDIFPPDSPKGTTYRINAGIVPPDHWIHDKEIGGGRIIGEVCHFVDLVMLISGARISSISAMVMDDKKNLEDSLVVNLGFENGSIASISYFSNGNKKLPKEYLEVFTHGQVAVIDDFKNMAIYSKRKWKSKLRKQDKGHAEEIRKFLGSIEKGLPTPMPFEDIYVSTLATLKIIESIRHKKVVVL